ncbi:uncharacterized protein TNCV_1309311 [Trichonephila clavipes]|nr:uncharacterized protein TNCV_1309311 [Trichonephila clavipes]
MSKTDKWLKYLLRKQVVFTCRNCGGGDRGRVAIYRPFREFRRAKSFCHLYGVLKANDRRTSYPCHDEFRGPRSDYVRQNRVGDGGKTKSPSIAARKGNKPVNLVTTRVLLATDHIILNHGQVTWTIPELAPPSPNYHTTPTGLIMDNNANETVLSSPLVSCMLINSTRGLLATEHVILNHGQVTWTTPELATPSPNYHTKGRTFQLLTDLMCIAALHDGSLVVPSHGPIPIPLGYRGRSTGGGSVSQPWPTKGC